MNVEQVKEYLDYIKPSLYFHKEEENSPIFKECFIPYDTWIYLSLDYRKGGDAVTYMDYESRTKSIRGVNQGLLPKLIIFLSKTNNHHLMKEVKETLQ